MRYGASLIFELVEWALELTAKHKKTKMSEQNLEDFRRDKVIIKGEIDMNIKDVGNIIKKFKK